MIQNYYEGTSIHILTTAINGCGLTVRLRAYGQSSLRSRPSAFTCVLRYVLFCGGGIIGTLALKGCGLISPTLYNIRSNHIRHVYI